MFKFGIANECVFERIYARFANAIVIQSGIKLTAHSEIDKI